MPITEIGDPRLQALFGAADPRDAGVRPTVRLPRKGLPAAMIAVVAVILAILLFMVLNERRTAQPAPAVTGPVAPGVWEAPPPLYVPPVSEPATVVPQTVEQPA